MDVRRRPQPGDTVEVAFHSFTAGDEWIAVRVDWISVDRFGWEAFRHGAAVKPGGMGSYIGAGECAFEPFGRFWRWPIAMRPPSVACPHCGADPRSDKACYFCGSGSPNPDPSRPTPGGSR